MEIDLSGMLKEQLDHLDQMINVKHGVLSKESSITCSSFTYLFYNKVFWDVYHLTTQMNAAHTNAATFPFIMTERMTGNEENANDNEKQKAAQPPAEIKAVKTKNKDLPE